MAAILVDKLSSIDLGRQGENLARTIEIDVNSILEKWPDATITLLVKRKGDTEPYPAETSVANGILYWPITMVDTANAGDGKIELHAVSGEVIAKSVIATIRVSACLAGTETSEVPEAAQGWVNSFVQKADDMRSTLEEAKEVVQAAQNAPPIVVNAAGALAAISDGAARPVQQLVSTIAAVQAGTGEVSPDNVRAITGWEAVTVNRTGRNLVDQAAYVITNGHSSTTITRDVIDVATPSAYDYGRVPYSVKAGCTYTLVIDWEVYGRDESSTDATVGRVNFVDLNQQLNYRVAANGTAWLVMVLKPDKDIVGEFTWNPNYGSIVPASSRSRIMLLEGEYTAETAPAFVPYEGAALTAALPETVYGGTLDWTTGLLTVTHALITLDGTEAWMYNSGTQYYTTFTLTHAGISSVLPVCSHYPGANAYAGHSGVQVGTTRIWLVDDRFSNSASGLKAWFAEQAAAGTPVQIVYLMAEPYTLQVDAQVLETLKGTNAIWSDCGDTAVAYIADTKLYIDNKIAALAAAAVNA